MPDIRRIFDELRTAVFRGGLAPAFASTSLPGGGGTPPPRSGPPALPPAASQPPELEPEPERRPSGLWIVGAGGAVLIVMLGFGAMYMAYKNRTKTDARAVAETTSETVNDGGAARPRPSTSAPADSASSAGDSNPARGTFAPPLPVPAGSGAAPAHGIPALGTRLPFYGNSKSSDRGKASLDSAAAAVLSKDKASNPEEVARQRQERLLAQEREAVIGKLLAGLDGRVLAITDSAEASLKLPVELDGQSPVRLRDLELKILGETEVFPEGCETTLQCEGDADSPTWCCSLVTSTAGEAPRRMATFSLHDNLLAGRLIRGTSVLDFQRNSLFRNCLLQVAVRGEASRAAVLRLRGPERAEALSLTFVSQSVPDGVSRKVMLASLPDKAQIDLKFRLSGPRKVTLTEGNTADGATLATDSKPPICFLLKKQFDPAKGQLEVRLKYEGLELDAAQVREWADFKPPPRSAGKWRVSKGTILVNTKGLHRRVTEAGKAISVAELQRDSVDDAVRSRYSSSSYERAESKRQIQAQIDAMKVERAALAKRQAEIDQLVGVFNALNDSKLEYTVSTKIAGQEVVLARTDASP